ncbi:NapC/NirT family cytochrome c [Metallumcola ferriviriculae]|uniref:NapC/NirT family cytochrome c n=1 Tax=Metallumcola ferriviriculae TaxID=3039180 RepID=A0AAU0UMP8_9FIRM|nr:NapC/NirT family cytochrome c [Desulfitibacteraceae bacterium MK1]
MIKFLLKALGYLGIIFLFGIAAFFATYGATSSTDFCKSCHEVKPFVESWEQSPHQEVHCFGCHEYQRPGGFIESKARGLSYLVAYYTQKDPIPVKGIFYESKCISCHLGSNKDFPEAPLLPKEPVDHGDLITRQRPCTECHQNTGHEHYFGLEERLAK